MTNNIEQVSRQRLPSYSDVPDVVLEYAAANGLRVSWQASDNLSQPHLNAIGVYPLDPEDLRSYSPDWYDENVGRSRMLQVEDGVFVRADAALMVQSESRYEELVSLERAVAARRARTQSDFSQAIDEELKRYEEDLGLKFSVPVVPGSEKNFDDRDAISVDKRAADDPSRRHASG